MKSKEKQTRICSEKNELHNKSMERIREEREEWSQKMEMFWRDMEEMEMHQTQPRQYEPPGSHKLDKAIKLTKVQVKDPTVYTMMTQSTTAPPTNTLTSTISRTATTMTALISTMTGLQVSRHCWKATTKNHDYTYKSRG